MKRGDHRLRVGITLTLLAACLFVLVFALDGVLSSWTGTVVVKVRFANVQGLRKDDPVEFCGVPCGRVRSLAFTPARSTTALGIAHAAGVEEPDVGVLLELEVPREVHAFLRSDTKATVDKTLTGVTVVGLAPGTGEPLGANEVLEGSPGITINDVAAEMKSAGHQLNVILESVRTTISDVTEQRLIVETLEGLQRSAGHAEKLLAELRGFADDNRAPVREVAERGASLVGDLEVTARELPAALAEVRASVLAIDDFLGDLRGWFRDHRGELSKTTEEVALTAENLSSLSQELRRRPWRLLHSPSDEEEQKLDLAVSVDRYARGALALRRAAERVAALKEAASDEPEIAAALEDALLELAASIAHQQSIEEGFWQRLQKIED